MDKLLVLYRISVNIRQQEFEEAYRKYKRDREQIPGLISEILAHSTDEPSAYIIVSLWQPEDFFAWLQSSSHAEVVNMLKIYKCAEAHQISRYMVVDSFDRLVHQ